MLSIFSCTALLLEVSTQEGGTSVARYITFFIVLYFIMKWAVKNGIKEAYTAITGEITAEDKEEEELFKSLMQQ